MSAATGEHDTSGICLQEDKEQKPILAQRGVTQEKQLVPAGKRRRRQNNFNISLKSSEILWEKKELSPKAEKISLK